MSDLWRSRDAWRGRLDGRIRARAIVTVRAPVRRAQSSGAGAFLGLADDGRQYWVKVPGNAQGDQVLVNEVIVGELGRLLGVCSPFRDPPRGVDRAALREFADRADALTPEQVLSVVSAVPVGWEAANGNHRGDGVVPLLSSRAGGRPTTTARSGSVGRTIDRTHDMSDSYLYWLVRYVPDVVRGERVNVAVVVGRDGGDWAIRVAPDLRRASRLGGDAGALRPRLERLERTIRDFEHPPLELFAGTDEVRVSRAWLELLSHRFNNVLQVSAASPVVAASARDGADFLFSALVETPAPIRRSQTRTRIVQHLGELYERTAGLELGVSLLARTQALVGRQRGRFDFAVGANTVDQLSHAFAFDLRDTDALRQELQSWNFVVSRLREEGALISAGPVRRLADAQVRVAVAYQEPTEPDAERSDVFEAALDAWSALGIHAVPSTELDALARDARHLVSA